MKHRKVPLVEGFEVDDYVRANTDKAFLIREGFEHLIGQSESEP